jgi:hypothetical protein
VNQSRTRTAGRVALVTVLTVGLLAACGEDEDDETAAATETTVEAASTEASPPDDAPPTVEDGVLTVELVDYGFEGLPVSVPAGTKLEVDNTSTEEFHELVAFRLPDGEERTAAELVELPQAELGALFGGPPATVLLAGPNGGEQKAAVGDGTLAESGRYLLICSVATGADPEELEARMTGPEAGPPAPEPDAGPPHFVHGMHADLLVE